MDDLDYYNAGFDTITKMAGEPMVSRYMPEGAASTTTPVQLHESVANRVNAPMPSPSTYNLHHFTDLVAHPVATTTDNYTHGGIAQTADEAVGSPVKQHFGGPILDGFKQQHPFAQWLQNKSGLSNSQVINSAHFGPNGKVDYGRAVSELAPQVMHNLGGQASGYIKGLFNNTLQGNASGLWDTVKNSPWLSGGLGIGALAGGWGLSKLFGGNGETQQPRQQPININVNGGGNPNGNPYGNPYTQNTQPQAFTKYSSEKVAGVPEAMLSYMIGQNSNKPAAPAIPPTPIDALPKEYHPNISTSDPEAWKMLQRQKVQKYLADLVQQSENGVI